MAKIRQNLEQENALKSVNDLLREIAGLNRILEAGEEEQYALNITGPEKKRIILPQNIAENTLKEIIRQKKKVIKELTLKFSIDLDDEDEKLLS